MPREATVPSPDEVAGRSVPSHQLTEAPRITPFRRLWIALGLSSLGDWLGLLAATAFAASLQSGYRNSLFAIGGVLRRGSLPAVLFGPFAGAFADRFDRRKQMVLCDLIRAAPGASIIVVHTLPYLFAASFAIEVFSLFWIPAKEASVPNLVPRERLEAANQISLVTTYGMALVAAVAVLAAVGDHPGAGARPWSYFDNADHPRALLRRGDLPDLGRDDLQPARDRARRSQAPGRRRADADVLAAGDHRGLAVRRHDADGARAGRRHPRRVRRRRRRHRRRAASSPTTCTAATPRTARCSAPSSSGSRSACSSALG